MTELCIMVAPNGARRTRRDHLQLPLAPDELARTAAECLVAGAGAIHLHVRDGDGTHSLDAGRYRDAIQAVRETAPEIVIQTTTEAAGLFDVDQQIAAVKALRPSCLSFSLAELMRDGLEKGEAFLEWAAENRLGIQFILYDGAQIRDLRRLLDAGRLQLCDAPRIIVVAGRYSATQDSDLSDFEALHDALVETRLNTEAHWMTCAFGRGEMACLERTIELGGHARVGFENAIVDATGRIAKDNAERVALVRQLARKHGRPVAGPAACAAILGRRAEGDFA